MRFLLSAVLVLCPALLSCSAKMSNGSTEVDVGVRGKVHIQYRQ